MKARYFLICGLITLCTAMASLVALPHLPSVVASHWDLHGNVNGYSSRGTLAVLQPAMMAGSMLLFALLPFLSPRHFEVESFQSTYLYFMLVITVGLAYFHGLMLWSAWLGRPPTPQALFGGVYVLLVLLGNAMPKVRRNFFMGVRTPWALADERVWYATHRLAAKTIVASGLIGLVAVFVLSSLWLNIVAMVVVVGFGVVVPAVYSFVYYKRLERQGTSLQS